MFAFSVFGLRQGSGGNGLHKGGDGCLRSIEVCKPLFISILSERRTYKPYGLNGGNSGACGLNLVRRAKDGVVINIGSKRTFEATTGDMHFSNITNQIHNFKSPKLKTESGAPHYFSYIRFSAIKKIEYIFLNCLANVVFSYALYIFGGLFIIATIIVLWWRLSSNIGLLTPILIPLIIVLIEVITFIFVASICTLYHWTDNYFSFIVVPINVVIILSLFWNQQQYPSQSKKND
ncbi:hypothetical protein RFI_03029 [Reticulomyxa filosa]|uniref:Hydantoinase B/oxoprolinase domain-containing protein n=1 Tax=Reticulomyxa filosa TaxID=46433 RepID=X6P7M2_RETFI|nr:hypothetical protein RFI_03029 [Reticulomyxa filosa]|eukprot:ETO34064.1 hypothetical protein RFI_03029 [Reticulomyxa filosa]